MSRAGSRKKAAVVNQRRMYVDWRHGQLHVRSAFPPSGGFDELTPLVCLHGEGETSRVFGGLLAGLGSDRSVYALDLPGFGESDPAPRAAEAAGSATAVADFISQLRLRQVDLLAHRWGGCVATELAAAQPSLVRRLIFVSAPVADTGKQMPRSLSAVTQPVLLLRLDDEQRDLARDMRAELPAATVIDLPEHGADALESAPQEVLSRVRTFLGWTYP